MNAKLTLTIEQPVIEQAKQYAKMKEDIQLTPTVKSLKGSFKAPENFDYKKELTNRLSEKYQH